MNNENTPQDIEMTNDIEEEHGKSDFMKVKEVAKRMSVTPDFIYKKLRTNPDSFKFAIVNVGGVILINRKSYEMWCEAVSQNHGIVE